VILMSVVFWGASVVAGIEAGSSTDGGRRVWLAIAAAVLTALGAGTGIIAGLIPGPNGRRVREQRRGVRLTGVSDASTGVVKQSGPASQAVTGRTVNVFNFPGPAVSSANAPAIDHAIPPVPSAPTRDEAGGTGGIPSPTPGVEVHGYRLEDEVGRGGAGIVFRATHVYTGRVACIKVFHPAAGVPPGSAESNPLRDALEAGRRGATQIETAVLRSIRAMSSLDHPNIVHVLDGGPLVVDQRPSFYLAMEYVIGVDLGVWSREQTDRLVLQRHLHLARLVALAMSAAHKARYTDESGVEVRGIVHGDLKPNNILVTPSHQPIIVDFMIPDLQRVFALAADQRRTTFNTSAFGTPMFMAPEQEQRGILTPAGDVFSLGVTFRYLFHPSYDHQLDNDSRLSKLALLLATMTESNPLLRPAMDDVASALGALA
jgi:hypothetical protein